jgi:hypothetical protein
MKRSKEFEDNEVSELMKVMHPGSQVIPQGVDKFNIPN